MFLCGFSGIDSGPPPTCWEIHSALGSLSICHEQELQNQGVEISNSVIEENEKPYQLICQENDSLKPLNSETTM